MAGLTLIFGASEPAGGAATADIVIATLGAVVLTTVLFALGLGHRSGRVKLLTNHCWIKRHTRLRRTWETETRVSPDSRTLRLSLGPARAGAGVLGRVEEELC